MRRRKGDDLNLSADEIAAFNKLGSSAAVADMEASFARRYSRYQAYRAKGLDGIASYDRGSGATRSVADDLRKSLDAVKNLKKYAPAAYTAMMSYPSAQPAGTEDGFRWVHLKAHDVPTIVLAQGLVVPDGDGFLVLQRQFYVSEGFNCEQAVAGSCGSGRNGGRVRATPRRIKWRASAAAQSARSATS
jgi:hypothetical protein